VLHDYALYKSTFTLLTLLDVSHCYTAIFCELIMEHVLLIYSYVPIIADIKGELTVLRDQSNVPVFASTCIY